MKKIIFLFALILAGAVNADYLYWMVDSESSQGFNWSQAKLIQEENHEIGTLTKAQATQLEGIGYAYAKLYGSYGSDYTDATSFFIELYNANNDKIAVANIGTYSSLSSYIFGDNSTSVFSATGFTPAASAFNVPEPTSGLLFLVGGMLLGLRRKRRV